MRLLPVCALIVPLLAACSSQPPEPESGVSQALAVERANRLTELAYQLELDIPSQLEAAIRGTQEISFHSSASGPLWLDFQPGGDQIRSVAVNGHSQDTYWRNQHLLLDGIVSGKNHVRIEFVAGEASLNRRPDFLYTLFVPDRASAAIPCFDQPDLKATWQLKLDLPEAWEAVSNGRLEKESTSRGRKEIEFAETRPISTYLFAFAAGEFQVERGSSGGRDFQFFHRESDQEMVARNRQQLFDLHASALDWLEEYTSIGYPFEKFDFVLVPAFQFGGMEHPGAVFYRSSSLFLPESATQSEILGRASLVAHETAHMWFGDLVTMRWFNDVWTKEVFANFMAAKIVDPQFPEVDHQLQFFLRHHAIAYSIDRSRGTHPIRQPLDNLNDAASLYGGIIYQKAPIAMRQLEELIGVEDFRSGMQEYLQKFSFSNATWPGLIEILDQKTEIDLAGWSQIWVEDSGRPTVKTQVDGGGVRLVQEDPAGEGRFWPQRFNVLQWTPQRHSDQTILWSSPEPVATAASGLWEAILPGADGLGYGYFELDPKSRSNLVEHLAQLQQPLSRAVAVETLWDATLEGRLAAATLFDSFSKSIESEPVELNLAHLGRRLHELFWGFLSQQEQKGRSAQLEERLWARMEAAASPSEKATLFQIYRRIATSDSALDRVRRVWNGDLKLEGLSLDEGEALNTALRLAVAQPQRAAATLQQQAEKTLDPFRKEQLAFLSPAASPEEVVRRAFFESLKDPARRAREPWVVDGLELLHHPSRAESVEDLILPALEMVEEIKRTGNIFFPKRWMDAVLGGHRKASAARVVEDFLEQRPDYPPRLRAKMLQSADLLFRKARH